MLFLVLVLIPGPAVPICARMPFIHSSPHLSLMLASCATSVLAAVPVTVPQSFKRTASSVAHRDDSATCKWPGYKGRGQEKGER
jgi:hypothetical protein